MDDVQVEQDEDIAKIDAERKARVANGVDLWDQLWRNEGEESWRGRALSQVYTRITRCMPTGASVLDVGGGIGLLARRLRDDVGCECLVLDHSREGVAQAHAAGLEAALSSVGDEVYTRSLDEMREVKGVVVATEVYEHLPAALRETLLADACQVALSGGHAFISVPNDRLGPDEEPQHTCKYTALSLLREAREAMWAQSVRASKFLGRDLNDMMEAASAATRCARVEVLGPYLLLVLSPKPKSHTLSVCTPARDEGADIEAVLASFRGVADEIVVGIDPRTTDNTRAIAEKYAEVIFDLVSPEGPPDAPLMSRKAIEEGIADVDALAEQLGTGKKPADDFTHVRMPEGTGVNFAWIRNQCLDHCTSEWVFMTEAHERLLTGDDFLLHLGDIVPDKASVGMVLRTGTGQQWGFPWLARRRPSIRYKRAVHNVLDFPDGTYVVQMPQVRTLHERVHERTMARAEQRKAQNRSSLFNDWKSRGNESSLFYLASELRDVSTLKAVERMREFISISRQASLRYHASLILAKELCRLALEEEVVVAGKKVVRDRPEPDESLLAEARTVLIQATGDDWTRSEHWLRLGDLAMFHNQPEEAYRFFSYASLFIGQPPFTSWWIDLSTYSYAPAQRMAQVCAELGQLAEALFWAKRVLSLLPDNAPLALEEARANIRLIKEAISNGPGHHAEGSLSGG